MCVFSTCVYAGRQRSGGLHVMCDVEVVGCCEKGDSAAADARVRWRQQEKIILGEIATVHEES